MQQQAPTQRQRGSKNARKRANRQSAKTRSVISRLKREFEAMVRSMQGAQHQRVMEELATLPLSVILSRGAAATSSKATPRHMRTLLDILRARPKMTLVEAALHSSDTAPKGSRRTVRSRTPSGT